MRVKRYVADSIQEAIARVKSDLGRNAIILHTKPFKEGGFLGLFSQRRVEVIAAVDDESKSKNPPVKKEKTTVAGGAATITESEVTSGPMLAKAEAAVAASAAGLKTVSSGSPSLEAPLADSLESSAVITPTKAAPSVLTVPNKTAVSQEEFKSLCDEIAEMKDLIRQVATKPLVVASATKDPIVAELEDRLLNLGIIPELVEYLIEQMPEKFLNDNVPLQERLNYCRQLLEANIMFSEPIKADGSKQEIIALIGPTGVGKTTTIAKLAANYSLFEKRKVGLITIDTYRIAAVEHLKTYGDIMNLPVEVVYTPADMNQAIKNLHECDLIMIDTAGRSPHNQKMMEELRKFVSHADINQILLVISATTQLRDMINIEEKFARIAYTHLVFTKLDETSCLGPITGLAWKVKRPISYLTVGQNVPDDIEVATPDKLIARLFEESQHG